MESDGPDRAQIIAEIYEVVLKPERYDHFMALWEKHISGAINDMEPPQSDRSFPLDHINDPDLEAHFQRAYEILEKLGREGKGGSTAADYAAESDEPTVFVSADGRIEIINSAAKTLFGSCTLLSDLADLVAKEDMEKLQSLLLGLCRPGIMQRVHVFHIHSEAGSDTDNDTQQLFLAKPMKFSSNQPVMLCLYAMGVNWDSGLETLLSDAFAFTSSELQIGRELCAGKSLGDIAIARSRSVHTLRTQVKSMLHKTGTASQADLVRVMVTLASFGRGQDNTMAFPMVRLDTGSHTKIELGGGRHIPVHQIGAKNGRPVLFIHGMLDGIAVCKSVGHYLERKNIRLIAPVRPNFADCPPAYKIETAPEEFAPDLGLIMDYFDIAAAPVIGHMAGSVYSFAAASVLQKRITGILNIAAGVPIKSMRQLSAMPPRQRVVAWTARFTPGLLPAILRTGISQIDKGDETEFMNALYQKGTCDRKAVENPDIRAAIHAGYQFAVTQGHRAFEVDSRHVTRDWSSYVRPVRQRTILAHGILDPTVTIKSVREFAARHDNIEVIEHNDAGQLLFYQKPTEIIATLCTLLD